MTSSADVFQFGTKAETLKRLSAIVRESRICDLCLLSLSDWTNAPEDCLNQIILQFPQRFVICRSSAVGEDGRQQSMAGRFVSVPNVPTQDKQAIRQAIERVFTSIVSCLGPSPQHQVLIQPMLTNVARCGVILTRALDDGAPYYVINYDEGMRATESVTQGTAPVESLLVSRLVDPIGVGDPGIRQLLAGVKELESLSDVPLDIEFALDLDGVLYILQMRPISTQSRWRIDPHSDTVSLFRVLNLLKERHGPIEGLYGSCPIYSQMADWNPAEMIGTHPRPLAYSIYDWLITRDTWRHARAEMGYYHPSQQNLMLLLGGQAFIDVRASLNSFLPNGLSQATCNRLVEVWLGSLAARPELHDKIEFDVATTCYTPGCIEQLGAAFPGVFSQSEMTEIGSHLKRLTTRAINGDGPGSLCRARVAIDLLRAMQVSDSRMAPEDQPLLAACRLLSECRQLGTLPFAIIARHAFIAESLLRSLVVQGAVSEERVAAFRRSLRTVTKRFVYDMHELQGGRMSQEVFLGLYGHLRPGTYDIRSRRYDQMIDIIYSGQSVAASHISGDPFDLAPAEATRVRNLFQRSGMCVDGNLLMRYAADAIAFREYAKFTFSRSISDALEFVARWGESAGFDRDSLSYLEIDELVQIALSQRSTDGFEGIIAGRRRHEMAYDSVRLGPIICKPEDALVVRLYADLPNYVTRRFVAAPPLLINEAVEDPMRLAKRIVCIESADPGYDWIFGYGIAGLITSFGGANSHMAIRCAEFDIPAAIGCGARLFDRVGSAHLIELDCGKRTLRYYRSRY